MRCARSATSSALLAGPAVLLALALGANCGTLRPQEFGEPQCPVYAESVQPLVLERCSSCHGAPQPAGGYDVSTYEQTVSRQDDGTSRVDPGENDSLFLRAVRGELPGHTALAEDEQARLTDWAERCRASPQEEKFHQNGWMTPTDDQRFHGYVLRHTGYEYGQCTQCHGEDLSGGSVGVACSKCHAAPVTGCNACHGDGASAAPPRGLFGERSTSTVPVGAHRAHLSDGPLHRAMNCTPCHRIPTTAEEEGHYRLDGGADPAPAELQLRASPDGAAAWDRAEASCTNSFCHAPSPGDSNAQLRTPNWTAGSSQAVCGTCHGLPPSTHDPGQTNCGPCHGPGYTQSTVDLDFHANGTVDASGDCGACHAAPRSTSFFDLAGRTDPTQLTVGLHDAHLNASTFRGPVDCAECHPMPTTLFDPNHMDGPPAEVFTAGSLSRADGATPVWDRTAATCSNTYCHGGGQKLSQDPTSSVLRTLNWTQPSSLPGCPSCHGIPPADGTFQHSAPVSSPCSKCHGQAIDAAGDPVITADPTTGIPKSRHLDGNVTGTNP